MASLIFNLEGSTIDNHPQIAELIKRSIDEKLNRHGGFKTWNTYKLNEGPEYILRVVTDVDIQTVNKVLSEILLPLSIAVKPATKKYSIPNAPSNGLSTSLTKKQVFITLLSLPFVFAAIEYFDSHDLKDINITGGTKSASPAVSTDRQDIIGENLMLQDWKQVCDRVADITIVDRTYGTASANNHNAYVFGYKFNCISSFGNETRTIYYAWIDNTDNNFAECIHHNQSKSFALSDGWEYCGGNFRIK